jgi:hypothetical protein
MEWWNSIVSCMKKKLLPIFQHFNIPQCVAILLICWSGYASAASISGKITDEKNQPLPFVNVYIKGTTIGTTANLDGNYSLELDQGECNLVFHLIGYRQREEKISVAAKPFHLDIRLSPESYELKEIKINANAEDPAYEIIRHAQKKRKFYLGQVERYSCSAYVKSTQKLISYPKKILGQTVDLDDVLDTATGIFYLSESVSRFSFQRPDRIREEMISSKVSGSARTYSFNQASDFLISFYESLVQFENIVPRGIVSPISPTAMLFYNYRLEGTFIENGLTVNKIKVMPKRKSDPVFTGDIYILDDSWRIHSVDLFITKDQQMEFLDTFRIHQSFIPVEKEVWMPFSGQFNYVFSFLGFRGKGTVLGINSDYNIHPDFAGNFFSGEIMKVNKDANKKDSSYWNNARLVPLTGEESRDYVKRDSTHELHQSKTYRDSVDRKHNKFEIGNVLSGYSYQNSFEHWQFSFSPLVSGIEFNTVEGWNGNLVIDYNKRYGEGDLRQKNLSVSLRNGFSNHHFNGNVSYSFRYDPEERASYRITAGTDVNQFSDRKPVTEFVNSLYSLLAEKNFMKIYEKRFLKVQQQSEFINGLRLGIVAEYARRIPLVNTNVYSFVDVKNRRYTSNDPLNPATDDYHFPENNSLLVEANLRIRFRQEYISRPEGKFITGSKYPTFRINYRKGIDAFNSDVNYDFAKIGVEDKILFGLFGQLNYEASYGKFLSSKQVYFMDKNHFNGNQTFISGFGLTDFKLLDYYRYSTTDPFAEAHAEHNFGGFILNKIPLIRKLKLNEIAGFHYLHTDVLKNYYELSFGIEKLNAFRIDFVTSFAEGKKASAGFVFGIKGIF